MNSVNNKKKLSKNQDVPIGYYDKVYIKKRGIQSKWHHQKFNFVRNKFKKKYKHLDYACASGTFINSLKNKNLSIGLDLSRKQISYAKKYENSFHKFKVATIPLPYKNSTFDIITVLELIEHCSEKENSFIFNELYRVLKPGGKIIITTPNYSSFWPLLEKLVSLFGSVNYEHQHINLFNKKKLYNFLSKKEFNQIYIETFIYFAPFFAALNWKLSNFIEKIEKFIKTPFGFLLCATFVKKK
tara:strand:+ start:23593 stop:24318 length:726 start_codon:yes stop_codon:yes gene_type:complete